MSKTFIEYCKEGNIDVIQRSIKRPRSEEIMNEAFFYVCERGYNEIVQLFLRDSRVNPWTVWKYNGDNSMNKKPLQYTEKIERVEEKTLCLGTWDQSSDFTSPLCKACEHGHIEIVKMFLARGGFYRRTNDLSLMYAVKNDHADIVELLLPYTRGSFFRASYVPYPYYYEMGSLVFAFDLAAKNGNIDIVKLFLQYHKDKKDGYVPSRELLYAAYAGKMNVVELLLSKNDYRHDLLLRMWHGGKRTLNNDTINAATIALIHGHIDVCHRIVQDPHCDLGLVLYTACRLGQIDFVRLYINDKRLSYFRQCYKTYGDIEHFTCTCDGTHGNRCNGVSIYRFIIDCIHIAKTFGHNDIVGLLISNTKLQFAIKCSPLMDKLLKECLADNKNHYGNLDIVKADDIIVDDIRQKPLLSSYETIDNTHEMMDNTCDTIQKACEYNNMDVLRKLLVDCDPSENNNECLCISAKHGHFEIVELLLNDLRVNPYNTIGCYEVIVQLHEIHGDVDALTCEKIISIILNRPVSEESIVYLMEMALDGYVSIIQFIVWNGYDSVSQNYYDYLYRACQKGHTDIVNIFVKEFPWMTNLDYTLSAYAAMKEKHHDVVYYLVLNGLVDTLKLFRDACLMNCIDIVRFLLVDMHINPLCDDQLRKYIITIAENNYHEIVELLMSDERLIASDNKAFNRSLYAAAQAAAEKGYFDIVKIILKNAHIYSEEDDYCSIEEILRCAYNRNQMDIVQMITADKRFDVSEYINIRNKPRKQKVFVDEASLLVDSKNIEVTKQENKRNHKDLGKSIYDAAIMNDIETVKGLIKNNDMGECDSDCDSECDCKGFCTYSGHEYKKALYAKKKFKVPPWRNSFSDIVNKIILDVYKKGYYDMTFLLLQDKRFYNTTLFDGWTGQHLKDLVISYMLAKMEVLNTLCEEWILPEDLERNIREYMTSGDDFILSD